jgi:hypothetical protein
MPWRRVLQVRPLDRQRPRQRPGGDDLPRRERRMRRIARQPLGEMTLTNFDPSET